jgi:hypothetical protein
MVWPGPHRGRAWIFRSRHASLQLRVPRTRNLHCLAKHEPFGSFGTLPGLPTGRPALNHRACAEHAVELGTAGALQKREKRRQPGCGSGCRQQARPRRPPASSPSWKERDGWPVGWRVLVAPAVDDRTLTALAPVRRGLGGIGSCFSCGCSLHIPATPM